MAETIDAPTTTEPIAAGAAAKSPVAFPLIGRQLGKFTIVERLGRGGSAEVFRADETMLGRSVVIKILRDVDTPGRIERFLREVRLASRLDHPYAAHVYAFGAEPDRVLWIAMEYVRGETLDQLIARRGPMPPSIFAPLFVRLCEVIHTAHELGIVHRDIKGGNVMVIERAGQLLPKLLDFGIAKREVPDGPAGDSLDAHDLTGEGATLGTPNYMAPEQWTDAAQVDHRADIYALGVLAYRSLTGHLPFQHRDRKELIALVQTSPPPPLDGVVPELAATIVRALAKAPEDRWPDAVAFALAIRNAVGGGATEAVPIVDAASRDAWLRAGPQPIADTMARLAAATSTVEADAALRELVAITCRWLAVLALATSRVTDASLRDHARAVAVGDAGAPWLRLARAAASDALPGLTAALAGAAQLEVLAERLDAPDRARTGSALAADVTAAAEALAPLEPLLAYQLVVGRGGGAESWQGMRTRRRALVVVWGELADGEVALIDAGGRVVARLAPFVQVVEPLPAMEPELFVLWRGARLVAAPWGYERDDPGVAERLAALARESTDTAQDEAEASPYPGLAAYGASDAERFFGRDREIEALINRLVRAPMVAVLGPSGVGKSSFLHAGVTPRLIEQHAVIAMRPGRHPMQALANVLGGVGEPVAKLRALGETAPRGVVLIIDQLEELITLCGDPEERRAFAETLAAAADATRAPVRVVVTLRDDFATVLESSNAFAGRFEVFVLATPAPDALRRILTEPARRSGVTIDARVVDDVVAEVAGRPASLPLVSFTVSRLWETRDREARRIDHDAYATIGGVAGALASYADEVYGGLARRDQDVARDLFGRLVAADGTRIPTPRVELEQLPGAGAVLDRLIDARLLVAREDDDIEIVHECLAERWPRLARWRSEDAVDRALIADVRAAARRWRDQGEPPDLLWRGAALDDLRRLVARTPALTDLERAFARDADRVARRRRTIGGGLVLGAMVLLAMIAGVMAYLRTTAKHAATLAEDRLTASLIAQGRRELDSGHANQALAFFGAALGRGADDTALRTVIAVASRGWRAELVARRGVTATAVARDGAWIAAADVGGVVRWWSPTGELLGEIATGIAMPATMAWLEAGPGPRLVANGRDAVAVIDTSTRRIAARVPVTSWRWAVHAGPGADELTLLQSTTLEIVGLDGARRRTTAARFTGTLEPAFDHDARHLYAYDTGKIVAIDLVTMERREVTREAALPLASSHDGRARGYVDRGGTIHLLDDAGAELGSMPTGGHPDALVFSPTGERFAVVTGHAAAIYATADRTPERALSIDDGALLAIRDGEAWTADRDGVIRHYQGSSLVASIPAHVSPVTQMWLAGGAVATFATDGALAIVRADATTGAIVDAPCRREAQRGPVGIAMVYSCGPEGVHIVVGSRPVASTAALVGVRAVAFDDATARAALTFDRGGFVVDRDGHQLVELEARTVLAIAFDDADHLLLVDDRGLARLDIAAKQLDRVATLDALPTAVAHTRAGVIVGHEDGRIGRVDGAREVPAIQLEEGVDFLEVSADRAWVVATLASGAAAILDGATLQPLRVLESNGNRGAAAVFDPTGDLLLRGGTEVSIWDRATGERLIRGLDLARGAMNGRFTRDGALEVAGTFLGVLHLPPDTRATVAILRDIECHVPLRASGERLEPTTPAPCPP